MNQPTASDRLEASLAAIAEHGERTNAFIRVYPDAARAEAKAVDDERRRGVDRGPLHGMPISIKDLIDMVGQPTTAASRLRAGHVATKDAPVVRRLREAGAVLIGKTNLHEFALGPTNDESAFGAVHNPHDVSRVAGGSSGGSAAAVATGMGETSIGSDTGGSIRIPAAACGVVGLKPSLGEVPTDNVVPLSITLDHVGPLARTVADAANVWAVLAGRRIPRLDLPEPGALTLGALGGYFTALLSGEVRAVFEDAIERLGNTGVAIETRMIEHTGAIAETYINISLAEAAHWHAPLMATRASEYQPGVRTRIERGQAVSAVEYLHAREMRDLYRAVVDTALDNCDALVLPAMPIVAPVFGESEIDVDGTGQKQPVRGTMLRLTQLFNLSGHPAISLPIPSGGLPVGLQLVGRRDETERLLAVAAACEQVIERAPVP